MVVTGGTGTRTVTVLPEPSEELVQRVVEVTSRRALVVEWGGLVFGVGCERSSVSKAGSSPRIGLGSGLAIELASELRA